MPTHELGAQEAADEKIDTLPSKSGPFAGDDHVMVTAAELEQEQADCPSDAEMGSLRKISAPLPWVGVGMCLIEFAERASYYGSTGPFNNFSECPIKCCIKADGAVNKGLPVGGNGAGAVAPGEAGLNQSAGALGRGSVTASALVNMFTFLAYVIPILGGIVAGQLLQHPRSPS